MNLAEHIIKWIWSCITPEQITNIQRFVLKHPLLNPQEKLDLSKHCLAKMKQ